MARRPRRATASGEQQARSADGPAGSCQSRSVTPIAFGAGAKERDRAVDAAAHRHGDAARLGLGDEHLPERGRERLDGERRRRATDAASSSVSPASAARGPARRRRRSVARRREPDGGPVAAAGRVSDDLDRSHASQDRRAAATPRARRAAGEGAPPCR